MQRRFQYDLMLMMVAMFLPVLAQVLPIPPKSYFICFHWQGLYQALPAVLTCEVSGVSLPLLEPTIGQVGSTS